MLSVKPDGIPTYLKVRPQWVVWALAKRNDKLTKVPYDPLSGKKASTTDLMTWAIFEEAYKAYEAEGGYTGVGFVFCSADPFVGIDFDDCRNPDTGEVGPRVLEYVAKFEDAYVETSVSGTGIHLITRGRIKGGTKKGNYELYDQDRFFCMTGVAI